MGSKFERWEPLSSRRPDNFDDLLSVIKENRAFVPPEKLEYGDYGLLEVEERIASAIQNNKRIALYADYDVDGTMSCVSWIWFLQTIGYQNFVHYIPCRFKEGYGVNKQAIAHLVENEGAQLVITMDTGITANEEAAYCRERGIDFVCTDHHKIQPERMPDCLILNPKMHPDERYQEMCGCGITFVLLRRLGKRFAPTSDPKAAIWTDLLALAGMATICDVVPLNGVNHRLARLGVDALIRSRRTVLRRLREATSSLDTLDESDVGFRLGPRINAVGRLEHADLVIEAFLKEDPTALIERMEECNTRRRALQAEIHAEARAQALTQTGPILFLGGDWHPGVVGIVASKISEEFWKPTWLFQRKETLCKGSARSIPGFDVTDAMSAAAKGFLKFGGHAFAGGFTFKAESETWLRESLSAFAESMREERPDLWKSRVAYDCDLPPRLTSLELAERMATLRPFGNGFMEPKFCIEATIAGVDFYKDKATGEPKHTAVTLRLEGGAPQKVMFFNEVHRELAETAKARFLVTASRNTFRGVTRLSLTGCDYET